MSLKVDTAIGTLRPFRWSPHDGFLDIADVIEKQYPGLELRNASLADPETALRGQFVIQVDFMQRSAPFHFVDAVFLVRLVPEPSTIVLVLLAVAWAAVGRHPIR